MAKERGIYGGRKKGTTKHRPQRAWDLHDQGMNKPEIARAMGISSQTVWRYLRQRPTPPKAMRDGKT